MADVDKNRNRIEDIKRHLYDRDETASARPMATPLRPIYHKVEEEWHHDSPPQSNYTMAKPQKPRMSIFKKFFIGAVVFFVCAISFAAYMFLNGGVSVSNDNIDIAILGNAFTKGGDELPIQVEITNRNNATLQLADLLVEYPRGASDNATDVIRLPRDTIGTIKKGETVTRTIKVTLYGEEQSIRTIKVSLEYHPEGSNAIFTKEKDFPVTISSAPLSLVVDAPTTATSDQPISFTVTANLNTTVPQGNTVLQAAYPNNFVFDSATPAPTFGNSVWSLASLTQTDPVSITVKGKLVGQDGDKPVFHFYAGTTSPSDQSTVDVVYNSLLATMTIAKPFLEAHILIGSQDLPSYIANGGSTVDGTVTWSNNLSTMISDAQIIVTLSGNAYDKSAVNPLEGYFDSANNRIVWDKNTIPELGSIQPGARGSLSFNFKPLSLIGSSSRLKNPEVDLSVSIKGREPSAGSTFNDINNFSKKVVKLLSDFQIGSSASFASGPLPPKAETETKYTVTWTLSNSANSVTQAQARSILPVYIKWAGSASKNEDVSYNATTREVIWNIGTVDANTGFHSSRESSFVLSLTPSLSQVGSVPQLMKDVQLSGTDSFTGTLIKSSRGPITTSLVNDPGYSPANDRVVQ